MRTLIRPTLIAALAATVCGLGVMRSAPALAAAPAPKGTLTSAEYRQLSAEQAAFKRLEHRQRVTWNELYAMCRNVGSSTALLKSVRANCDTGVGIDQSLSGFFADVERCSTLSTTTTTTTTPATGTTTAGTGTTTTGASGAAPLTPVELSLFACLEPEYAVISRAARSVYRAQANLRSQVLARDFVGRCRLTLAPTKTQLRVLRHFVATSRQLAADVALITKVADGQAPASALKGAQIRTDSAAFNAAGRAFGRLHRPQKLSVCPHG